jgi:hypothetical protein
MTKNPTHRTWCGIKTRCYNERESCYPYYGGRGIRVCDRWLNSFENFLADMGDKPSAKHSIERKDVNGHYEPNNCCWATQEEQANNKTDTKRFLYQGRNQSLPQWAREYGIKPATLKQRMRRGWLLEDALTVNPADYHNGIKRT